MTTIPFLRELIALLLVIFATLFSHSQATAFSVVEERSKKFPDITTHEIHSGDVILGISEYGGGYINKLFIPKIGDVVGKYAARYGRGGQVSIRDKLHSEKYNPTQGGFTDFAGTHCSIDQSSDGTLIVKPHPCSLWNGDGQYDFTEWENLAIDPYLDDNGDSDSDNLNESELIGKQATEITSEFDFLASYENVMDGSKIKIPTFKFYFEFRFIRKPGHCLEQFGKGTPVYQKNEELSDRSNDAPCGKHPSRSDSLTGVITTSAIRGDKAVWDPVAVFHVGGSGRLVRARPERSFRYPYFKNHEHNKPALVIFSDNTDPETGTAIGYYCPNSHINVFSTVGRLLKDHSTIYEDMRITDGLIVGSFSRTPTFWLMGIRTINTGLLNIDEVPADTYETIRGETYILVGSPVQILKTSSSIHPMIQ
jgi:hypothetical protein